ncbi:MAG: 2OG-Fe(II) oxygenase [Pyrinomonadaceae bacterium]|nr:2OG-Fe(II) oxygenase [Pyrinomonadaceae bacterium]
MKYALPFDDPLLPNFAEYVISDGFLPHETIRILEHWDNKKVEKAAVSGEEKYNEELRKSSLIGLEPSDDTHWIYERIASLATSVNAQRYGFELRGFLEPLQLMEYKTGDLFDWHMDFSAGEVSHRKLSITVQLSDAESYEGGDLQFMINKEAENAPRRIGSVIVFPSFIRHRVTEVTSGTRYSIVAWLSGPPYR